MKRWLIGALVVLLLAVAGVAAFLFWPRGNARPTIGPPRAAPSVLPAPPASAVSLPIRLPLAPLERGLERAVPTTLWTIDDQLETCAPAARVKLFGKPVKVTPDLKCRVSGTVTRGPLTLVGHKGSLRLQMPVSGTLTARDAAGLGIRETATAAALVTADVVPDVTREGQLTARLRLAYDWQTEPGVTLLGNRIRLTRQADAKLAPIIAQLERDLPGKLSPLALREELAGLWRQGFTVQSINRRNPAAWLKITPRSLGLDRIEVDGRELVVHAALGAITELVLGDTPPAAPEPTPMPLIGRSPSGNSMVFHAQLLADYATLVPPISKALAKVAAKGIDVPDVGRVKVRFGEPTLYGTDGGRLVMGIGLLARGPRQVLDTRGYVWLTARTETRAGSEEVAIRDVKLATGAAGDQQFGLLVAVMSTQAVTLALEQAIDQDFTRDYRKLMAKIRRALAEVPIGNFRLAVTLDQVGHGAVSALGQGLYMPVVATGTAAVTYVGPNAPLPERLQRRRDLAARRAAATPPRPAG